MNKILKTLAFLTLSFLIKSDPIGELEFEISLEENIKKDIKTILNGDENFIVTVASRISSSNKKVELNDIDLITNNLSSGNILDKYPRLDSMCYHSFCQRIFLFHYRLVIHHANCISWQ